MNRISEIRRGEPYSIFLPLSFAFLLLLPWLPDAGGPAGSARGWVAAFFGGWLFTLSLGVLLTQTPRLLRVPPVGRTPAAFLALMVTAYGLALWGGNRVVAQAIHLSCVPALAFLIAFRLVHKGNPAPIPVR